MSTPISLLICALGGEGGGVLSQWLIEAARHAGYPAQCTSIPGVAQRTGATTYYIEVSPESFNTLGAARPIFSLNPVPGALDALVSSELLETSRQIALGFVSPERTSVITSSSRSLTTIERMHLADGRRDSEQLMSLVRQFSRSHHILDMNGIAKQSGTVVSAVMLGAIAASGLFPFSRQHYESAIGEDSHSAASKRGFTMAWNAVMQPQIQTESIRQIIETNLAENPVKKITEIEEFPLSIQDIVRLGHARVYEYQNQAYCDLYLKRLKLILKAEQAIDPQDLHKSLVTKEMARWLALWMAFDDIVRVAELKSRASRWQRVRKEVKIGDADILRVYDHFKPGIPEFAALLPKSMAHRLLKWDKERVLKGHLPWALPLKIGSHSVIGMMALRSLALLKFWRPMGSRFINEQEMINVWMESVIRGLERSWILGHELALCGQLIKGYGATNERGKSNLLHVVEQLAQKTSATEAATAIAAVRKAALEDEGGKTFDASLVAHGAATRPSIEKPIRFMRKPGLKASERH